LNGEIKNPVEIFLAGEIKSESVLENLIKNNLHNPDSISDNIESKNELLTAAENNYNTFFK
jgi:hypothetical protein